MYERSMKVSVFPTLLTLIVAAAIGYLSYDMAHKDSDPNALLVGVGTFLSIAITLGCVLGLNIKNGRMSVNLKVSSIVTFIVLVITNLCYAGFGVSMPYYVIVLTLLIIVHLWLVWILSRMDV